MCERTSDMSYLKRASKIICIGRNYAAHIAELNNPTPIQPFFFQKPHSSLLPQGSGEPILIPRGVVAHHEIELAVVLNKRLRNLDPATFTKEDAIDAIEGYALAIDITARNVQDVAKRKGLPWTIGKGFDTFLPISAYIPKEKIPDPYNVDIHLEVNGQQKQNDNTNLMLFPIHTILSSISSQITLEAGDIILTGTPKGVGPMVPGDVVTGGLVVNGEEIPEAKLSYVCEEKPGPYEFKGE